MGYSSSYSNPTLNSMQSLAVDPQALDKLKLQSGKSSPEAIKETAKQFESLFMRELVKSMREATMKSGMLDNAGTDLGNDLMDQQLAVNMSGQPGGLSDLIAQQLTRQAGIKADGSAAGPGAEGAASAPGKPVTLIGATTVYTQTTLKRTPSPSDATLHAARLKHAPTESQINFVSQHSDAASKVEKATGIPASFMLGQAGHETGWGRHQIKTRNGEPSFNLFGIKAGPNWNGKVAEVTTTEYVHGTPQKTVARFRAYDSYEDSFKDFARLISDSPRYAKVRTQTQSAQAFASGLQKAGYATDPEYAAKLSNAINTTLHLRRLQV